MDNETTPDPVRTPSIKRMLAKGAFWIAAARALGNLVTFLSMLLLARFLTPADFGLVAIATTISAIVLSITELSLASALIYRKSISDEHFDAVFSLNMVRGILLGLIILGLGWPIATLYGDTRLVGVMAAMSLSPLIGGLSNPKVILFSRQLVFWQDFVLQVSQKMAGFIVAVLVAISFRSYWALLASLLTTQIFGTALSYFMISYRPRLNFSRVRDLLSFSVWLTLGQAINTLNWKFDHLIIGYFLGNSALGYYAMGDNLALLPTREATMPISQALFPGFAKLNNDMGRLRRAYERSQALLCAIAFPLGCGFALIARPFVEVTMGERWENAILIIQLLSSIFALQTMVYGLQPLAMAKGETRELLRRDIVNVSVRVPLVIIGMFSGGLLGIVLARCVSGLVGIVVAMMMVRRLLGLSVLRQLATNGRFVMGVIVMAMCAYGAGAWIDVTMGAHLKLVKLVIIVISGAVTYLLTVYICWLSLGRPEGPEQEIAEFVTMFLHNRFRPRDVAKDNKSVTSERNNERNGPR
ncbi:lipopolysaccharide biosynthesis protein [Bradyrhizobium glycinis]|uniref:lipopolysaccharide biosynthesis protein n=1 Tax=Bradyrhizobium glycinis TaxID=2751812 RepID=UPI0018D931BB|nr:lipopolysaccharide biosynthesis protein [Bradyrhizobium glycinis]MBH5368997.1 lipopolysaccharide biosynthesis protein [Bradyrhizobium glycinis]